jgi:dUTP pyrophosphatase
VSSGKIIPGDRILVSTGISMSLPLGTCGIIHSKSSVALKGIDVGAGIIDSDYRGIIKILLINNSKEDFYFGAGERLAQLIVHKIELMKPVVVERLNKTKRGNKGFGSTNATYGK